MSEDVRIFLIFPLSPDHGTYSALEQGLERHSNHPVLEPTYNPTLLARAPSLEADIAYLLDLPESSWRSHPLHHSLVVSPPIALTNYVARLRQLAESDDPSPLLAHAYVRYLGDLSGGQSIRHTIAKAYDLESPGPGLSFYEFKELRSSEPANLGELRRIKEWYREGMNKGVGDDVVIKGEHDRTNHPHARLTNASGYINQHQSLRKPHALFSSHTNCLMP